MRRSNVLIIAGQLLLLLGVAAQLFPDPRPPYSYLGCFDNIDSGIATNQVNPIQVGGGDPVKCQSECDIFRGQYLYMQGEQCYCQGENQDPSPPGPRSADDLCNQPCIRNASAPCGGEGYFTLYGGRPPGGPPTSTSLEPDPRPPYAYRGCYEATSIVGQTRIVQDNGGDPAACQAACDSRGAAFAGMFRGNGCLCHIFGQPTEPQGGLVGNELCNAPCARNLTAPCGDYDGAYITVYGGRVPTEPAPPTTSLVPKPQLPYRYIGCYNDGLNIVDDFTRVGGAEGNPVACQDACSARGSTYVLMYFFDCQCSNPDAITVLPFRRPVADGFCNEACFDDSTAACGGGGVDGERVRYTVYSNRTEPEIVSTTTATGTATETPAPTTVALTPDPRPPFSYLGCWLDQVLRLFNYEQTEQTEQPGSPAVCQSQCRARQAVYVAMLADFCFCQSDASEANRPVGGPASDGSCNLPCNGNVTAPCGGIVVVGEGDTTMQQYFWTLYGLRNETSSSSTLVASTSSASGMLSGSSTSTDPAAGTSTSGTASPSPGTGSSSTGTSVVGTSSTGSAPGGGGTTSSTSTFPIFPETPLPSPSTSGSSLATSSLPSSSLASGTGSASSDGSLPGSSTGSASQGNPVTATTSGTGTAGTAETSAGGPFVSTSTFFLVGTPVVFSIFPAGQAPPQTRAS